MLFTNIYFFLRSFRRELFPVLMFAQCFGIMPICNGKSSFKIKLLSFRMLGCLLVHIAIAFLLLTLIYYYVKVQNFDYSKIVAIIFFFNCFAIALNFVYIARKLPSLMDSWSELEARFPNGEHDTGHVGKILAVSMSLALVEHLLSKYEDYERAALCFHRSSSKFETFVRCIMPKFFQVWHYNHFFGVYIITTCFLSTVLWNFADVFLITIFSVIFVKLKKFNRKIQRQSFRHCDEKFWLKARLNYVALHEQMKAMNCVMSCLLLLSLLNDFYFICNQALGVFKWVCRRVWWSI